MKFMKKIKHVLIMAFAALAIVACSDEVVPEVDGGGTGGGETEGDAWISLKLRTTGASKTRALNDPDKENGTPDESNIQSVRAIFFDTAKKVVADKQLQGAEMGIPGQPSGVSGSAFKITKDAKYLLIIANEGGGMQATFANGTSYNDVNKQLQTTVDLVTKQGGTGTANYFMMTNAKGDLEPSWKVYESGMPSGTNPGDLKELTLYNSSTLAEQSALEITIDRVVAKVRVYASETMNSGPNDPLARAIEWDLNVTNKYFYPASKRVKTNREVGYGTDHSKDWVWSDMYHLGSYREDPNYNYNAGGTAPTWNGTTYSDDHYNFYNSATDPDIDVDWTNLKETKYCLENTQSKDGNVHAYTTQVILKAQFAPRTFVKREFTADWASVNVTNTDPGIHWLKIGTGAYTFETLITWIEEELTKKYADLNPDGYTAAITTAFNDYLRTKGISLLPVPSAADFTNTGLGGYSGNITTLIDAVKAAYGADDANGARYGIINAGSDAIGPVTFYSGAINYYKIMIEHDNDKTTNPDGTQIYLNELGEFGVVRNSVYDIHINNIFNSGYPKIPDPDKDKKDEDEDMWLAIKINVNPWTWYKQELDL